MGAPTDLPTRFPCWCRATYSWGGENKKDLGFIEGDLIEALNAGDGLWWVGRLRRDPRAIGSFPSNFVKVLDESFQPAPNSRNASLATLHPGRSVLRSRRACSGNHSRLMRLLDREVRWMATAKVHRTATRRRRKRKSKFRPYSSMKTAQAPTGSAKKANNSPLKPVDNGFRVPSPPPRGGHRSMAEAASPQPGAKARVSRQASIDDRAAIAQQDSFDIRAPTSGHGSFDTRAPSSRQVSKMATGIRASKFTNSHHTSATIIALLPRPHAQHYHQRAPSAQPHSRVPSPAPERSPSPLPSSFHDGSAYPQLMSRTPSPNPIQQHRTASPMLYDDGVDPESPPPPPPPAHRVIYQQSRAPSPQPYQQGSRTPIPPSPGGSHMTPSPLRDAMNDVMTSLHDMSTYTSPLPAPTASNVWSPDEFELVRTQSRNEHYERHTHHTDEQRAVSASRDNLPKLDDYVQRMDNQLQRRQSQRTGDRLQRRKSQHMDEQAPIVPLKGSQYAHSRSGPRPPTSDSHSSQESYTTDTRTQEILRHRKSAFELRSNDRLSRTYTTKTNATNSTESSSTTQSSNSTQLTSRSVMSGHSAGGFSATSAGSLARRKFGLGSQKGHRPISLFDTKSTGDLRGNAQNTAPSDSGSGPSYHESHSSNVQSQERSAWNGHSTESAGIFGGLGTPKHKRSGFFRKMIESAKTTAKTGAANARATVSSASRPSSRAGFGNAVASRPASSAGGAARDMGLSNGNEWMQVRRDVNRSNTLSRKEREERVERAEMLDLTPFRPIELLHEQAEGDESLDGFAVTDPTDFNTPNLALVDKSTRFISSIPPAVNAAALAQNYLCRPHRTDVQKLRAIFTWVAERITWEEDYDDQPDPRRVIQSKRGCSKEIAALVRDMCSAVGLHAELVRGFLKAPGETPDPDGIARGNHWWNALIVDGEWRIMDAALASPSHPRRGDFSGASVQVAESWYFLARPMEVCYTHIPLLPEQQHIVPAVQHEVLTGLPCACPTYFRHSLELADFDTSILHLDGLEMAHLHVFVPEDVECIAETEARTFARDNDGDLFESGDIITTRALSQPEWIAGRKRFTIKALLPPEASDSTLKVYAGKRGLMHSVKDNPHSLAFALPLTHSGQNPPYEFFTRHPTPHAQRHDLYIMQPQCAKLVMNNTFVFAVRQHPSALSRFTPDTWGSSASGNGRPGTPSDPYARPGSAMSMRSTTSMMQSVSGSQVSDSSSSSGMTNAQLKPAKLAIQTPSQKIIRLTRKMDGRGGDTGDGANGLTTVWETVVKISERGTWRGLVLADRSARWCVFAEWECV
ncbi:hypothetical protein AMS68_007956 [Peltaster fructicola]|uniref:SH3 domain-containing protein n=1 Tax=Peltaster fructicola TaxID=286661 RepID=A0A6H0Y6I6_9PEZI|nr:hypothetical protein AMS68_007956 [Peltaster fructicola]